MNHVRIFVSSTFFDLSQVREDIRATIMQLGHEPLLNEYPSFPVSPSLDTIENCKKTVRNSDFLLLIIGGRRGSLDPVSGKSITNIEFETATESGIDCFVFINEQVMTLLEVWKANPDADFTAYVNSPQVFEFVARIRKSQKWIFTFKHASEISEILRNQLSVFFKDLLVRKREGRLDPIREFLAETARARELALDRPPHWEYQLAEELLRTKLAELSQSYSDFIKGLLYRPKKPVTAAEYFDLIGHKMEEPVTLINIIKVTMEEELMAAFGKPGEPGDAVLILRAVNKMVNACHSLLEWELDLSSFAPPAKLQSLGQTLKGLTLDMVNELKRLPDEISKALDGTWTGVRTVQIGLSFSAPPQLEKFQAEMNKASEHPEWLLD